MLAYKLFGTGSPTVVIDVALGTCSAEWWHIARALSEYARVVTFDRAGYGESRPTGTERTPRNIAQELHTLLDALDIRENIVLLGHSQGGFYAVQYAAMFPQEVVGMALLDPATPYDSEFAERLTPEEYQKSGVDKTPGMRLARRFTALGLGFLFRPLLKKAPPFYYRHFEKDAEKYLLRSLSKKETYVTALEEYRLTHEENSAADVRRAIETQALGDLPVRLLTHSSEVYHKELQKFGGMDPPMATKIEALWQEILRKTLGLSRNATHAVAERSGHFIHLTDSELVLATIHDLVK